MDDGLMDFLAGIIVGAAIIAMIFAAALAFREKNDHIEVLKGAGWYSTQFDDCECMYAPDDSYGIRIEILDN